MGNADEILKIFRQIAYENRKVRLLNLYKGIPISYAASIVNIGEASVTVRTEKIQLVCMYLAKETHIQNVQFPHLVQASVVLVDAEKVNAMLSHFSYKPERFGELTQVNVQPASPIQGVMLSDQNVPVSGELADISLDGVAVIVEEKNISPACHAGEDVRLRVQFPQKVLFEEEDPTQTLELHGSIANIKSGLPDGKCRIGVELHRDSPARLDLARFISLRQTELLREIRSIYELVSLETGETS